MLKIPVQEARHLEQEAGPPAEGAGPLAQGAGPPGQGTGLLVQGAGPSSAQGTGPPGTRSRASRASQTTGADHHPQT